MITAMIDTPAQSTAALIDDLPDLTEKQQAFVEAILSGMGVAAAYRASRDCSGMADATITANATREHYNPSVQRYLRLAKMAKVGRIIQTKEDHEAELVRLREFAVEQGDPKAAIAAEISRGKLNGHYVERSEHHVIDPAAILEQIRAANPRVAAALAQEFNVPGFNLLDLHASEPAE